MRTDRVHRFVLRACILLATFGFPLAAVAAEQPPAPRLILQITVDQLRGDLLPRHRERFGTEGFRRLMERGTYFTNAHYGTANTFTAAGHAVLVTGADTPEHGIVANEWFDRESGKRMYATFDAKHGMSPTNLTSSTFGDELVSASAGKSRAFSVSGKDRSAIIPGGHLGKAFWFSDTVGKFTTSTYYFPTVPAWIDVWNDKRVGDSEKSSLQASRATPLLDEMTLDFARELIDREMVGQGTATDYLSVSLSSTDYIGHAFGPNSREQERNLIRLDGNLATFLRFLDRTIGRDRFLLVLAADHGVDDVPENHRRQGFDAERFYPGRFLEEMNTAVKARFGITRDVIAAFVPPGIYLDRAAIAELHLDAALVARVLADEAEKSPGVAYALTRSEILTGRVPQTALMKRVQRGFHPARSGDVIIIQKQFWFLYTDPDCCAAMHGSPYSYDTYVPVIFAGAGVPARRIARNIEPASIAPTLAALQGIKPPSGSSAPVLPEILSH